MFTFGTKKDVANDEISTTEEKPKLGTEAEDLTLAIWEVNEG
jgi:hypothetical protein